MNGYSVSCDGVALGENGVLFSIAVYTDGEGYNSYVYSASDVAGRTAPNVQTELLDIQLWLTSIWRSRSGQLFVADDDGNVRRYDGVTWSAASVSPRALTCVWGLAENDAYVSGDEGIVYRWDGATWAAHSPPLGDVVFSIRGTGPSDLYACGANGLFWHYDGRTWTPLDLPTNQRLLGLLALDAADILVCGASGTLFRGSGAAWNDVSQPGHDFHSLARYHGTIYIAGGGEGVFSFDGVAVTNVKDTISSYRLVANLDYLASAGGAVAARFDGSNWFGSSYS